MVQNQSLSSLGQIVRRNIRDWLVLEWKYVVLLLKLIELFVYPQAIRSNFCDGERRRDAARPPSKGLRGSANERRNP